MNARRAGPEARWTRLARPLLRAGEKGVLHVMPNLTILPNKQTIEVATGTSLLSALRTVGALEAARCETKCIGQCHVFVQEGRKSLSKIQRAENEVLDTIVGVGSKSRCACQALMGEQDVSVELLGFASG